MRRELTSGNMSMLPSYLFSRDWWQFSQADIDLILHAMRQTVALSHEDYYRLTDKGGPPAAVDRTLLLAVSADVIVHLWHQVDQLTQRVEFLTQSVTTLQQGGMPNDDEPAGCDPNDLGGAEPSGFPA